MTFERVDLSDDVTLYCGDCLEVLPTLAAGSVDSIVTDPPYGLSFMGKDWDYGVPGVAFWTAALRVAKPGAHLLAFGGTRTHHRLMVAIEDAGWEIRDTVMWVYGSGFPKSHQHLKPAWEPIIVARKSLDGTVAQNVLAWGTGAINVDGCRVGTDENLGRPLSSRPEASSVNAYNWSTRPNPLAGQYLDNTNGLGRWPANLIHDGSDEVVGLFPETAPSKAGVRRNKYTAINAYSGDKPKDIMVNHNDSGSAARFFYCAKASKRDRDDGFEGLDGKHIGHYAQDEWSRQHMGNTPDAKRKPVRNHHPTVKPTDLMRYLCRLVTPLGGVVLDPFMGSGSTGKAAVLEGFDFIGVELDAEYLEIARARIAWAEAQPRQERIP